MKHLASKFLAPLAVVAALTMSAVAAVPPMTVVVSKDGKTAYKGTTSAAGTFATGKLEPGSYVIQFNSSNAAAKNGQYVIVVSAGKKKVTADAVAGDKLAKGGVAMKLDVDAGLNITGQVASGGMTAQAAGKGGAKTKIVNGKTYIWVGPETGSNMGGRWVEEGTEGSPQFNMQRSGADTLRGMQDHSGPSALPGGG